MRDLIFRLEILAGVGLAVAAVIAAARTYFSRSVIPRRFDRSDITYRGRPTVVEFVSPFCYECREALPLLKAATRIFGAGLRVIDAKEEPALLNKYGIRNTPTILVVDEKGSVRGGWEGLPPEEELENALIAAGGFAAMPAPQTA